MKKRIATWTIISFAFFSAHPQVCDTTPYEHTYWFNGIFESPAQKIITFDDGGVFLLGTSIFQTFGMYPSSTSFLYITKLNTRGTPLWTKTHGFRDNISMTSAVASNDGGFFVSGFTNLSGSLVEMPWAGKFTANGDTAWTYSFQEGHGQFFRILATADGGCLATGFLARRYKKADNNISIIDSWSHAIIVKFDSRGTVEWSKERNDNDEDELAGETLQLKDGKLIVCGFKDGFNADHTQQSNNGRGYISCLDVKTGDIIWQTQSKDFYATQLSQLANGNILVRQNTQLFVVNVIDGSLVSAVEFGPTSPDAFFNFNLQYAGSLVEGDDLYYDYVDRSKILLLDIHNYNSIGWGSLLPGGNKDGNIEVASSASIQKSTGSIYLTGWLSTNLLSTDQQLEQNTILFKTDLQGNSPCSDTFNIAFSFKEIQPEPLYGFGWNYDRDLMEGFTRNLSDGDAIQQNHIYCFSLLCCRDTTLTKTINICKGGTYTLPDGKVIGKAGLYSVVFKTQKGCDSIYFITVNEVAPAQPHLGNDTCFAVQAPVKLAANATGAESYKWQDGTGDSLYNASVPGVFWVQAKNVCGIRRDTIVIYDKCDFPVYVPNAFTPNGDGHNDVFKIADMRGQKLIDFSIYNRWGECVFRTSDPQKGWDGAIKGLLQPATTFVYIIHYAEISGKSKYLKGVVNLIR